MIFQLNNGTYVYEYTQIDICINMYAHVQIPRQEFSGKVRELLFEAVVNTLLSRPDKKIHRSCSLGIYSMMTAKAAAPRIYLSTYA